MEDHIRRCGHQSIEHLGPRQIALDGLRAGRWIGQSEVAHHQPSGRLFRQPPGQGSADKATGASDEDGSWDHGSAVSGLAAKVGAGN